MKILHVINSLNIGGAEKLIVETLPAYKANNIEVDLFLVQDTNSPYLKELRELNCCKIFIAGIGSLYNPFKIFRIVPYINKYDLIHVHLFPAQYWVVLAKCLRLSKTLLVFTEHNTSNRRIQNNKFKYIERFIYSYYSRIVCITPEVKKVLVDYTNLDKNRFQVIGNGVSLTKIQNAHILEKKKLNDSISESDKLIIQIAGFRAQKDQKTVIRSLLHLDSNIKLLLVGEGELLEDCKKLVLDLELKDRVLFLGMRSDVPSLLKTADLSVISSHWEGFGLAAVEGMAAGKPLLASNVGGLANVVEGAGVLFEKGNDVELASKIKKILSDDIFYNELVSLGLERAKKYDISNMVDSHINMYKNLLKQ